MELKDLKTREKIKEIYRSEVGFKVGKQIVEDFENVPPKKMESLTYKLMECELEAVKNYSGQFIEFLNSGHGYRNAVEFVYVICGLRLALRSLQGLPFDDQIKHKIKELNEIVKQCVGTDSGFVEHPTEDTDA